MTKNQQGCDGSLAVLLLPVLMPLAHWPALIKDNFYTQWNLALSQQVNGQLRQCCVAAAFAVAAAAAAAAAAACLLLHYDAELGDEQYGLSCA